jgi:hypothetical protein
MDDEVLVGGRNKIAEVKTRTSQESADERGFA